MIPKQPMTAEERAFCLLNDLANASHYLAKNRQFDTANDIPIAIRCIQQAVYEARVEGMKLKCTEHTDAYAKGFSAAREMAAMSMEAHVRINGDEAAQEIRAMQPDGE